MLKRGFLAIFLAFAITDIAADKKIVCYYGSWAAYRPGLGQFEVSNINPNLCTHLIYTFVGINTDGSVKVLDNWLDLPSGRDGFGKFTRLRQKSPGVKVMVAIGGWNEGSVKYSEVVGNPDVRARFVQNVVNFLRQYNFDGFDVDWEYPNQRKGEPADRENYIALLSELRNEFNNHGYILSVAVAAAEASASQSYIISQLSQHVHFINLMTYDLNGPWDNFAGLNAPLYPSSQEFGTQSQLNVNSAVRYWLSQGAPADKLILGVPTYGRSFTLANPGNNNVGAPTVGAGNAGPYTREAGMLGYNEICESIRQGGWSVVRDSQQHVPYAFKGNQWVGYDNVESVQEKAEYVKAMGLGGAMVWSIETDDFRGTCGEVYPILNTLNRVLKGHAPAPAPTQPPVRPTTPSPPPPPTQPSTNVCTREGYIRDPKDCSVFYYCQNVRGKFISYRFQCPDNLAFDPSLKNCNYRSQVPGC